MNDSIPDLPYASSSSSSYSTSAIVAASSSGPPEGLYPGEVWGRDVPHPCLGPDCPVCTWAISPLGTSIPQGSPFDPTMNLPASTLPLDVEVPKHPIQRLEDLFFKADEAWYNSVKEATAAVIEHMKTEEGITYNAKTTIMTDQIEKAVYKAALTNISNRKCNMTNAAFEAIRTVTDFAKALNWKPRFDRMLTPDVSPSFQAGDPI